MISNERGKIKEYLLPNLDADSPLWLKNYFKVIFPLGIYFG
jgi:hypothetical protein